MADELRAGTPSARHVLAVPSLLAVTRTLPGPKAASLTFAVWPNSVVNSRPSRARQTRAVWSVLPVAMRRSRPVECHREHLAVVPEERLHDLAPGRRAPDAPRPVAPAARDESPVGANAASVTTRGCLTRPSRAPVASAITRARGLPT